MSTAPCDLELEMDSLRADNDTLRSQLHDAAADAKGWMIKYSIERDLAQTAQAKADMLAKVLDDVQGRFLKAEDRVETLLCILEGLSKTKSDRRDDY